MYINITRPLGTSHPLCSMFHSLSHRHSWRSQFTPPGHIWNSLNAILLALSVQISKACQSFFVCLSFFVFTVPEACSRLCIVMMTWQLCQTNQDTLTLKSNHVRKCQRPNSYLLQLMLPLVCRYQIIFKNHTSIRSYCWHVKHQRLSSLSEITITCPDTIMIIIVAVFNGLRSNYRLQK